MRRAVFIGGPVSYADSLLDYEASLSIHGNQIPYLFSQLIQRGIFVIYISTNMVFGQNDLDRSEHSRCDPLIPYGKIKYHCEQNLRKIAENLGLLGLFSIIRICKQVSKETSPFGNWLDDIKLQKPIRAFDDLYMSPLTYYQTSELIYKVLELCCPGIFHLSNCECVSYYEFAYRFGEHLGRHLQNISVIKTKSFEEGISLQTISSNVGLDMELTVRKFGINQPRLEDIFEYLQKYLIT